MADPTTITDAELPAFVILLRDTIKRDIKKDVEQPGTDESNRLRWADAYLTAPEHMRLIEGVVKEVQEAGPFVSDYVKAERAEKPYGGPLQPGQKVDMIARSKAMSDYTDTYWTLNERLVDVLKSKGLNEDHAEILAVEITGSIAGRADQIRETQKAGLDTHGHAVLALDTPSGRDGNLANVRRG